jgi:hypothetical protein
MWAWINHSIGDFLAPYTAPILRFAREHLLETTLVCVVLAIGYKLISRKRRLEKARS